MKNLIRLMRSRSTLMAASALAVAVAVAAGIAAGQGNAAPALKGRKTSHLRRAVEFERPRLEHGLLAIKGTDASERIALRLQASSSGVLQIDVGDDGSADFRFGRAAVARLALDARGGDDLVRIDESNGVFTDSIPTTIDGAGGDDALAGGSGAERLLGGDGNDSIDGNRGTDVAFMGAGDDVFIWDPGDGSDVVEGQDGHDTMLFNGAGGADQVDLTANGNRLKFFRQPGAVTMDTAGVERVDFIALGGADVVTVNDLAATDVTAVDLDLGAADGQADRAIVNGTNGDDSINVSGDTSGVVVSGLSAVVGIQHQEPTDELAVNGLGGNDTISAAALAAGGIALTLDGGAGDDALAGGQGLETLRGGDGSDSLDGNRGNDLGSMGSGDDVFVWDPGDGSDVIEGEAGADTMLFNGAGVAEQVDMSANGSRLRFFRQPGAVTMDTAGVERVDFIALGGADVVTVNDLAATDVDEISLDLGASDGQADRVVVNGTDGDDTIDVSGDAGGVKVSGSLAATIAIIHPEAANDRLEINTLAGADTVDTAGLGAGAIQLFVDGTPVP